jgi:hypothetical protein
MHRRHIVPYLPAAAAYVLDNSFRHDAAFLIRGAPFHAPKLHTAEGIVHGFFDRFFVAPLPHDRNENGIPAHCRVRSDAARIGGHSPSVEVGTRTRFRHFGEVVPQVTGPLTTAGRFFLRAYSVFELKDGAAALLAEIASNVAALAGNAKEISLLVCLPGPVIIGFADRGDHLV